MPSGSGQNITIPFAPVVHAYPGSDEKSITEALRREKVAFGQFLESEVFKKGYAAR
jgi:hypothetical protein